MARFEQIIKDAVDIYLECVGEEGKKKASKESLVELLNQEQQRDDFQGTFTAKQAEEATKGMDKDQDGKVNFNEFFRLLQILAKGHFRERIGKPEKGEKKGKKKNKEEN